MKMKNVSGTYLGVVYKQFVLMSTGCTMKYSSKFKSTHNKTKEHFINKYHIISQSTKFQTFYTENTRVFEHS